MPTPLSPLAALEQVLQSPVSAASLIALPGRTLVMLSPNMSLLSHHGSTLPLPVMPLVPWLGCPRSPPVVTAAWLNILPLHLPSSTPRCLLGLCWNWLLGAAWPCGHPELVSLPQRHCSPVAPRGLSPRPWHSTLRDLLCSGSVQGLMREGKEKKRKKPS